MKAPTLNECAVSDFLAGLRDDENIDRRKFNKWEDMNYSNDLCLLRIEMVKLVKQYNRKLDELKAEINRVEVF